MNKITEREQQVIDLVLKGFKNSKKLFVFNITYII